MFDRNEFLLTWNDHYSAPVQYENEILMLLEDDKEASIVCKYQAFKKKEDFMFNVCMNEKQTKEQQAGVWDNLRLDERSGKEFELIDVSWTYEGSLHQMQLSRRERLTILRAFIPLGKQYLETGYGAIAPPYKDLMAVSYPHGLKVKDGFISFSAEAGQQQRDLLAQRMFNWGAMKDFGWAFAKYSSEGKIQPL